MANLHGHNIILGTPFLFQHKITFRFNPSQVIVGSADPVPIQDPAVSEIASRTIELIEDNLKQIREELHDYTRPLCREDEDIPLPPFRAINHTIPLIDPDKIYLWHLSRCPEPLRPLWGAKQAAYLKNEWWIITNSTNTVPMLFLQKPQKEGEPLKMRMAIDLHEQDANTKKMASPLPDMDATLRHAAVCHRWSLIDML